MGRLAGGGLNRKKAERPAEVVGAKPFKRSRIKI
jgi:hypothetical protein